MLNKIRQLKNKLLRSIFFWGSLGPSLLIFTFIIFALQSSICHLSPFWWVGFGCSCLLGIFVTLLSLMEVASIFLDEREKMQILQEELSHLQSSFREVQMGQLEEKETQQHELQLLQQSKDEELKSMRAAYEKLFADHAESKSRASSLQISLEEALGELGKVRQLEYLKADLEKRFAIPSIPSVRSEEAMDAQQDLLNHIRAMNRELLERDEEILTLQEILTQLLEPKKAAKPKKSKKQLQIELIG